MHKVSILAFALLIGNTSLGAQVLYKSENIGFQPMAADDGRPLDVAVDLVAGTLGIGLQVSKLVTPHVGLRAGANYFSLNKTTTQSDVEYNASLKFQSYEGLVDFFPSARGAFRLSGGLLSNQTKVDLVGTCSNGNVTLNSHSYTCAQVGTLTGSVKFPSASPYVGLGFGTPAKGSRVHFVMDLGAAFGKPTLSLNASNSGGNPQLATDMQAQRDKTQKDIEKFAKVYPVAEFGLGVRF